MTGFILDYGTENHGHVEWDQSTDSVRYWSPDQAAPQYEGGIDEFALRFPDIVLEMRRNRVIRVK